MPTSIGGWFGLAALSAIAVERAMRAVPLLDETAPKDPARWAARP